MLRTFNCIVNEHNYWLLLTAGAVCICASAAAIFVLQNREGSSGFIRRRWIFLAALLAGCGTWATHFVAMLGYSPAMRIGFDLDLTLLSAALAVGGAWFALMLFDRAPQPSSRVLAGVALGTAITLMHYVGMLGLEASARKVWDGGLVVGSWCFSMSFAIAALEALVWWRRAWRLVAASGLLAAAILSLHFTGMGALLLVADPTVRGPSESLDGALLALTIAVGIAGVLLVTVFFALAERRLAAVELKAARDAAATALHDALTGLPNRRFLSETLPALLDSHARVAVVAVDLDRFKPVNDLYGHAVGDELLTTIAGRLRDQAGGGGLAARLGGDEFVIVAPFDREDDLIGWLSATVANVEQPVVVSSHELMVGGTLGVALFPGDGKDPNLLLRRADIALYRAKNDGRGRYAFFEAGMDTLVTERAELERDLRAAVRDDQIEPYYQPLVRLASGRVSAFEVLARWPHPTRGLLNPARFIPIAEEIGLIGELSLSLLRRACRDMRDAEGAPRLSVNVAPAQLRDACLPQKILQVLAECGFPPSRLEIEITEDALIGDFEGAHLILTSLKNVGVRLALDDFGTGYSSLRHLRELPFDVLKIDRSFISGMIDSAECMTIVRTIVLLAQNLGLSVTAEGIETSAQAAELKDLGCDTGQGFLFGYPSPSLSSHTNPDSVPVVTAA